MNAGWIIAGIVVPWWAGAAVVAALDGGQSSRWLRVSAGWFAGQILVMAALYATLVLTGQTHARAVLIGMAVLAAAVTQVRRARRSHGRLKDVAAGQVAADGGSAGPTRLGRVLMAAVAISLTVKLFLAVGAHALIPSRSEDALAYWLFKAKVVAFLDELPDDPAHDYYRAGSNPRYPVFLSLSAAWLPTLAGGWHERVATLPWLLCYVNLILLVAGGLRRWLPAAQAWFAAYVVGSMPLVLIHVYRPGYADLPLAAFLAAATAFLLTWRSTGSGGHLALGLAMAAAAACVKREGPVVAAVAVLALVAPSWRRIAAWPSRARMAGLAGAIVAVAGVATAVDLSDLSENVRSVAYHGEAWRPLWRHAVQFASFNFFFPLVAAACVIVAVSRRIECRWPSLLVTAGLCFIAAAPFVLTENVRFALNDQTPSRLLLQIAPAMVVALAIPLAEVVNRPRRVHGPDSENRHAEV